MSVIIKVCEKDVYISEERLQLMTEEFDLVTENEIYPYDPIMFERIIDLCRQFKLSTGWLTNMFPDHNITLDRPLPLLINKTTNKKIRLNELNLLPKLETKMVKLNDDTICLDKNISDCLDLNIVKIFPKSMFMKGLDEFRQRKPIIFRSYNMINLDSYDKNGFFGTESRIKIMRPLAKTETKKIDTKNIISNPQTQHSIKTFHYDTIKSKNNISILPISNNIMNYYLIATKQASEHWDDIFMNIQHISFTHGAFTLNKITGVHLLWYLRNRAQVDYDKFNSKCIIPIPFSPSIGTEYMQRTLRIEYQNDTRPKLSTHSWLCRSVFINAWLSSPSEHFRQYMYSECKIDANKSIMRHRLNFGHIMSEFIIIILVKNEKGDYIYDSSEDIPIEIKKSLNGHDDIIISHETKGLHLVQGGFIKPDKNFYYYCESICSDHSEKIGSLNCSRIDTIIINGKNHSNRDIHIHFIGIVSNIIDYGSRMATLRFIN